MQPNNGIDVQLCTTLANGYFSMIVDQLLPGGMLDPSFGSGGRNNQLEDEDGLPDGIAVGPDGNITTIQMYGAANAGVDIFRLLGDPPTTGQLVVTQEPSASLAAGSPFGLTVDVEDSSGNLESSYDGPVTIALGNSPVGANWAVPSR